ncbi:UNVERIFIED_CONTAM: hypothetical protein K2H54_030842 [Gekko kuhli]
MQKTCSGVELGSIPGLRKWKLSGNRKEPPTVQVFSAEMCRNQRERERERERGLHLGLMYTALHPLSFCGHFPQNQKLSPPPMMSLLKLESGIKFPSTPSLRGQTPPYIGKGYLLTLGEVAAGAAAFFRRLCWIVHFLFYCLSCSRSRAK